MAKKKDYLHKAEQGVILGTSLLLLNGVAGCSLEPMDTPPTEPTLTKGPTGLPGGLPGQPITYYPPCTVPGNSPILNVENKKYGFIMTEGYCVFRTTIPRGYKSMEITMNEHESGYTRKITKVETSGQFPNFEWFKGSPLILTGWKSRYDPNYPALDVAILIHSLDKSPVILYFKYTYE